MSETFHCDTNPTEVLGLIPEKRAVPFDPLTKSNEVVFNLSDYRDGSDIFMLIRVEKVLDGDIQKAQDSYSKSEGKEAKLIDKAKASWCVGFLYYFLISCCGYHRVFDSQPLPP